MAVEYRQLDTILDALNFGQSIVGSIGRQK